LTGPETSLQNEFEHRISYSIDEYKRRQGVIVATAGHIDHGKSTLVRALTGVDTDRLPEEKRRGISIDLGFAYWKTGDGRSIGFVDVPGHERFVRNMLAGVCAIDWVMLVVAADDGVMPQTIEHLNIVDMLGVSRGIAVVTKTDRVQPERVAEVQAALRNRLQGTRLVAIDILPVSATTGQGLPELRNRLTAAAREHKRTREAGRCFRYAIDRSFTIAGSGTVVTGTVVDGVVAVGDKVTVSPTGVEVRVRGLQQAGRSVSTVAAGERCAINLAGAGVADVGRDTMLVHGARHAPTQRLDVELRVLPSHGEAIRHWTPVHLHLGTRDLVARIGVRHGASIRPGESAVVQLILESPVSAANGDRFILRDQSAQRTIGGGIVLDPFAEKRTAKQHWRDKQLAALASLEPRAALEALAASTPAGLDLARFGSTFNLTDEKVSALTAQCGLAVFGEESRIALRRTAVDETRRGIASALAAHHAAAPREIGLDVVQLHARVAPELHKAAFTLILRSLVNAGSVRVTGSTALLASHVATDNPGDLALWQAIQPLLDTAGFQGLTVAELAATRRLKDAVLRDFLHRKARTGDVIAVTPERFYLRTTLIRFAHVVQRAARATNDGLVTAAQVRDLSGIGRGLVIQILERLDRLGVTRRLGDRRSLQADFESIFSGIGLAKAQRMSNEALQP
jgi:selenocysteine-specific elongation factor